ncbi:MAG: hypothetical protein GYA21_19430 [Myxococcales bacterium]|nr:hypothetical protein [Myxococcales bacterium]
MIDALKMQEALVRATGFTAEQVLEAAGRHPGELAASYRHALGRHRTLVGDKQEAHQVERDRLDSWLGALLGEGGLLFFGGHLLRILTPCLRAAVMFRSKHTHPAGWLQLRLELAAAADGCYWNLQKTPIPFDGFDLGERLQRLGRIAGARQEMDQQARGLMWLDVEARAASGAGRVLELLSGREAGHHIFEQARCLLDPSRRSARERLACARGVLDLAGQAGSLEVARRCQVALYQIGEVAAVDPSPDRAGRSPRRSPC